MKKTTQTPTAAECEDGSSLTAFRQNYIAAVKAKGCEVTVVRLYDETITLELCSEMLATHSDSLQA